MTALGVPRLEIDQHPFGIAGHVSISDKTEPQMRR
jgi:hypothetical protein